MGIRYLEARDHQRIGVVQVRAHVDCETHERVCRRLQVRLHQQVRVDALQAVDVQRAQAACMQMALVDR